MKKLTKPGKENIVKEMMEVFRKHGVLSHVDILYNGKWLEIGSSDLTRESNYEEYSEPTIKIREDLDVNNYYGNKNTITVMYDGGPLHSCMSGEFGYDWRDRLEQDLEKVFGPYHLAIEEIDNVCFTLMEGVVPEYELVAKKLSR